MLKTKFLLAVTLLLSSFSFVACDDPDGKWDPIQITVNGSKCKSSTYKVPANGGEFKISSKNYGSLWINSVKENGKTVWPEEGDDWTEYKNLHVTKDWCEIKYETDLIVNIHPQNDNSPSRSLTFDVECGDAFGSITLLQE